MPNFLSLKQVAEKLHVSVGTVKNMIKEKRLVSVRLNANTVVVNEDALLHIKDAKPTNNTKGVEALRAYHATRKAEKEKAAKKPARPAAKSNGKIAEQELVTAP